MITIEPISEQYIDKINRKGKESTMQVPIKIKFTKKCLRCGLRYPRKETACTHCTNLSDREVQALQEEYESYHEGHQNLGRLFLYIAIVLIALMLVAILSGI